jgi:fatty-acyl-CoA synthase
MTERRKEGSEQAMSKRPGSIRTHADIEAFETIPLADRLGDLNSSYDLLRRSAAATPQATALVFLPAGDLSEPAIELSYGELLERVTQSANLFHSLGLGPRDVVSYLLPNLPETHYVVWGGEAAGIVNGVNPLLEPAQIAGIMNAAGTKIVVTMGPESGKEIWEKFEAARALMPTLTTVLHVGAKDDAASGIRAFDVRLAAQPCDRLLSGRVIGREEIAAYFHTGGTTGTPKLAQHTHLNELANALAVRWAIDLHHGDTILVGMPLFHVNAVIMTGMAPFLAGARVVQLGPLGYRNKAALRGFWPVVERYRASLFVAVPTIYAALLDLPVGKADISSLRFAIGGAAPMSVELFRNFEAATGLRILEGYGLTEGTCVCSINPRDGERRIGSVGLPLPYQEMKAVKLDADGKLLRDCAIDEIGNIAVKGPNVFPGYRQEKADQAIWVAPGWLNTGDLGRQDAQGYFWLTGRQKELIIRGGHNIDPAIIEEAMAQHPAIALAAAVGKPDAYAGELPVVYVTLKPGKTAGVEELMAHARAHVPERAAVPAEIFVIDALPLTAVGKIFKPRLRFDAAERVFSRLLAEACAGLAEVTVGVEPHELHGSFAIIRAKALPGGSREAADANMRQALAKYSIRYEIAWR